MNHLAGKYGWLEAPQVKAPSDFNAEKTVASDALAPGSLSHQAYVSLKNEADKVVVYERAGLLFVFNFHPTNSYTDYRVGIEEPGEYRIVLSSDDNKFGGFDNIKLGGKFLTTPMEWNGRKNWLQVNLALLSMLRIWC